MATNLLIVHPEVFWTADTTTKPTYDARFPYGRTLQGGRGAWAEENASSSRFTSFINAVHPSAVPSTTTPVVTLARVGLMKGCGIHSVVIRGSAKDWATPSTISNLKFWLDTGVNVTDDGNLRVTSVTERSSNAFVGSQATLANKPYLTQMASRANYLQYSEKFDDAVWAKSNCSITANAVDGAGVAVYDLGPAEKLVENTANSTHFISQDASPEIPLLNAETYRLVVYAKPAGRNFMILAMAGTAISGANSGAYFNVSAGTVTSTFGNASGSISSLGHGWYKCTITCLSVATGTATCRIFASPSNGTSTYVGDGTSGIYIFGAYFNNTTEGDVYLPTDAQTKYEGVNSNRAWRYGLNDVVDFGNPAAIRVTGSQTVFAAVRFKYDGAGTDHDIINQEAFNASGYKYYLTSGDMKMRFRSNQAGTFQVAVATNAISSEVVQIVGFTKSAGTVTHYTNNTANGSGAVTDPVTPTANFTIGSSNSWSGEICEVVMYDAALGSTDRQSIVDYLTARWVTTPTYSNHDIQTQTLQGPHSEDIFSQLSGVTAVTNWRLELDGHDAIKRRNGHVFLSGAIDLGKDPIFGRVIQSTHKSVSNRYVGRRVELHYRGITAAKRQTFETYIGKYADSMNFILYPTSANSILGTLPGIEVQIESYEFTPTEHGKNDLRLIFSESL